jgi:hypothetical protein
MGRGATKHLVMVWLLAVSAACSSGPTEPGETLEGGVLATFTVSGESFHVWTTNAQTIQAIFDLRDGLSTANIPNGALRLGQGLGNHNEPWAWHLDPVNIEMAEATIELCDGRPSLVDSLLDDYLIGGRFCPWGAELVEVVDLR